MYLGPYHFEMAPIERVFSFIKSKDLNKNDLNTKARLVFKTYLMITIETT